MSSRATSTATATRSTAAIIAAALVIAFIAVVGPQAHAQSTQLSFTEDFKTFDYQAGSTTADWDTAGGEVRLFDYQMTIEGSYTQGFPRRIAVHGDRMYVATTNAGVRILNANTRSQIGTYLSSSYIADVLPVGNLLVVSRGGFGVDLVDVTNPGTPSLINNVSTSSPANMLARNGNYVYVGAGNGLDVIDISDPASAVAVNEILNSLGNDVKDMVVRGNYLYIAAQSIVVICDITNPAQPNPVQSIGSGWFAYGVEAQGNTLYVMDWIGGVRVVDITNPLAPSEVTAVPLPAQVWDAVADGSWLYVAAGGTLHALDITSPQAPVAYGSVSTGGQPVHLARYGTTVAVVKDFSGVDFVRVGQEAVIPNVEPPLALSGQTRGIAVDGNRLYVCRDIQGLYIYDISQPNAPVLLGNVSTNDATSVAIDGDYAYVADWTAGVTVVDVSDPTSPVNITSLALPGYAQTLAVGGGIAVVSQTVTYLGFAIVDISDPTTPVLTDTAPMSDGRGVAVQYPYAYVTDTQGIDVKVLDLNDPANVSVVANIPTVGITNSLTAEGTRLVYSDNSLRVVDISDPTSPVVLGSEPTTSGSVSVTDGEIVYVSNAFEDLQVYDISNPAAITRLDSTRLELPSTNSGFTASGDFLFLSQFSEGIFPVQVRQRHHDDTQNFVKALSYTLPTDVQQVSMSVVKQDSVDLTLYANSIGFVPAPLDGWVDVAPSTVWWWQGDLYPADYGQSPSLSEVTLHFRYLHPVITSITDIPGDQGGRVRIEFARSSCDFQSLDSVGGIDEYAVYRLIPPGQAAALDANGERKHHPLRTTPANWDYVGSVPARYWDDYALVVPTLADSIAGGSANYTTYMVSALGLTGFFDSPPDSGYSIDNLVPAVPENLVVAYNTTANHLNWSQSTAPDFQYFRVYRDTDPSFTPDPSNLVHATTENSWFDLNANPNVHYKVTAVDFHGNESDAAASSPVTAVPDGGTTFALLQNVPNPFNPTTTIRYVLPSDVTGHVTLRVYDVSGRLVQTLVDQPARAGAFTAVWNGRDARGNRVASGVYFYRLSAGESTRMKKMVLVQ